LLLRLSRFLNRFSSALFLGELPHQRAVSLRERPASLGAKNGTTDFADDADFLSLKRIRESQAGINLNLLYLVTSFMFGLSIELPHRPQREGEEEEK
jgi:hypothetical protein